MSSHTFQPSLQDISLKRFRLRYSVTSDCYYLHWDNNVCPQLAKIEGLANGAMSTTGLTRYTNEESRMAYLGLSEGSTSGEVQWKLDFSRCGLAVRSMTLRATADVRDGGIVTCRVTGDGSSCAVFSDLGDQAIEVPHVAGKKIVTISAHLWRTSEWSTPIFLPQSSLAMCQCPLDMIIELMVVHNDMQRFVGDLLLGLKFSSSGADAINDDSSHVSATEPGQLQVHVVEGAGLVDMETHKPFHACIKCGILPAQNHLGTMQTTSPRHNAYPTWSKEITFPGLDKAALQAGGLEVLLTDRHFFHNDVIGGIRLSIPQKKPTFASQTSAEGALCVSTPSSPSSPMTSTTLTCLPLSQLKGEWLLTPPESPNAGKVGTGKRSPLASPLLSPRGFSKSSSTSSPTASPVFSPKFAPFSPKTSSPKAPPRSPKIPQESPRSPKISQDSPRSPRVTSRLFSNWTGRRALSISTDTDSLHWWMDSSGTEVHHWQDMLSLEGEWVYCWHTLRPKLQPASF
ncbi:hypothetical protein EMCRGX_G029990 [Ephydatia muelleri]|eukprot:Em0010g219a